MWPVQIADALRGLIHQANLAREAGHDTIPTSVRDELITRFRHGVLVGLSDTTTAPTRPGSAFFLPTFGVFGPTLSGVSSQATA